MNCPTMGNSFTNQDRFSFAGGKWHMSPFYDMDSCWSNTLEPSTFAFHGQSDWNTLLLKNETQGRVDHCFYCVFRHTCLFALSRTFLVEQWTVSMGWLGVLGARLWLQSMCLICLVDCIWSSLFCRLPFLQHLGTWSYLSCRVGII